MSEFKEPVLWDHQDQGFKLAVNKPEYGFIFDAGTGKTLTVIKTLRHKYAFHKRMLKTLIITPKITLENWQEEWLKFSRIPESHIVILDGPIKKRIEKLEWSMENIGRNIIVITNYDAVVKFCYKRGELAALKKLGKPPRKKSGANLLYDALMAWQPEVLVNDESHRLSDRRSKWSRTNRDLARTTMYRYIMTGTFLPNSEQDIFSQFLILDKGATFGTNFKAFQVQYFYDSAPMGAYQPIWVLRDDMKEVFKEKIAAKTLTAKKEDCIDLPDLVETVIKVSLTPDQRKHYDRMRQEMITFVEDQAVVAEIAITKMLRLAQICSGFVKTDEGKIIRIKGAKADYLADLLKDLKGQKIIIWAVFHESYKIIAEVLEKLNIKYLEAHGLVKGNKREIVDKFNDTPEIEVLIGNPGAIGEGINIKSAGVRIYYDRDFSYVKREQSEARNFRGGSVDFHDKILSYDLVMPNTIDTTTVTVVKKKLKKNLDILNIIREDL